MKYIAFLFFSILTSMVSSCTNLPNNKNVSQENNEAERRLGKYVYIDRNDCLHANRKCSLLCHYGEGDKKVVGMLFVNVKQLDSAYFRYYCPRCVTEKIYEELAGKGYEAEPVDSVVTDFPPLK